MVDNARNTKYIVDLVKSLETRVDEIPPQLTWSYPPGTSPVIRGNCITLNQFTANEIVSEQKFNIDCESGLVFQFRLPAFTSTIDILYVGGGGYGAWLFQGYIFIWGGECSYGSYPYTPDDLYQQVYDGRYVNFILNGTLLEKIYINDRCPEQLFFGFDGPGPENNVDVTIKDIFVYQTGKRGNDGDKGADCNSILSTYAEIDNPTVNLQNYGISGDFYLDNQTNIVYGPKLGLCGSLYFDDSAYNGTGPVLPTLVRVNDSSSHLDMGTGDFTIEWWQYARQGNSSVSRIFSIGSYTGTDPGTHDNGEGGQDPNDPNLGASIAVSIEGNNPESSQAFYLWINSTRPHGPGVLGGHYIGDISGLFNRWAHIAVVRSLTNAAGLYTVYIDGEQFGDTFTGTDNLNDFGRNGPLTIGGELNPQNNTFFSGHITNFRWTKGTARYTNYFDVSRVPFSADGAQLLLNANDYGSRLTDTSGTNKTVTNAGSVPVSWNVRNPYFGFKNCDAWVEPLSIEQFNPPPFVTNIQSGETKTIWNWTLGYNSVLIYLSFATSTDVLDITNTVIVAVNINSARDTSHYVQMAGTTLPDHLSFGVNGTNFNLIASGTNVSYPYIGVKIISMKY